MEREKEKSIYMARVTSRLLCLLLLAVAAAPALAGDNDAPANPTPTTATAANSSTGAALNPLPAATGENATALLGVLVMTRSSDTRGS